MHKKIALALLSFAGCSLSPGALTLVFPSDADKAAAAHATIVVVRPSSPTDDQCPRYLGFAKPDPNQVESSTEVDLNDGVPSSSLKKIPTGYQTLIVNVTNTNSNLILIGCRTGQIGEGTKFEVDLMDVNGPPPDFTMPQDIGVDAPPPDLAMHKYLQVTVTEIRASARKISNATVTITDSGSKKEMGTTDPTGVVKLDTVTFVPPFSITVTAPASMGYTGAVTLSGVSPTWTSSDTIAFTIPIELDPPATSGTNSINVTVSDGTGQNFAAYYIPANGLLSDQLSAAFSGNSTFAVSPLATSASYRLAVVDAAQSKIATNGALVSTGQSVNPTLGGAMQSDFHAYSQAFSLGVVKSPNAAYTTQQYGVMLILPASQTQAAIPIFPDTAFAANGNVTPSPVPAMPSTIQNAAVLVTELIANGAGVHAELRHALASPTPASDSFPTPVPDPPAVTITPSTAMANMPFTISATPPGTFPISSAFVHVTIHDTGATPMVHWHLIAPAANPTTIVAPASVLAAGTTYAVDVAFVDNFQPIMDGTVQATMTDDYTKLIRIVPAQVSQSTTNLTVN